jgi:hypothetical protein
MQTLHKRAQLFGMTFVLLNMIFSMKINYNMDSRMNTFSIYVYHILKFNSIVL